MSERGLLFGRAPFVHRGEFTSMINDEPCRRRRAAPPRDVAAAAGNDDDEPVDDIFLVVPGHRDNTTVVVESRRRGRRRRARRRSRKRGTGSDDDDDADGFNGADDLPFYLIFLRVGTVVGILGVTFFSMYRYLMPRSASDPLLNFTGHADWDDDDEAMVRLTGGKQQQPRSRQQHVNVLTKDFENELPKSNVASDSESGPEQKKEEPVSTPPPLPRFNLSDAAQHDAYAYAERFRPLATTSSSTLVWQTIDGLLNQFADLYGGQDAARAILDRGMTSSSEEASETLERTACRVLRSRSRPLTKRNQRHPEFRMVFGGYSVTAGRGNYYSQSFPFVMEKQLHTVFDLLNLTLVVENHAIGGVPSFPYGWCMDNFFGGEYADAISWDFSMNEAGGDPRGLEAYLRHAHQLHMQPKVFVKDTHMATSRRGLIRDSFGGTDHVVIHTDPAAQPFLSLPEEHRPIGFREWRKFGAPVGAPGQSLHHPAVKEHILIAWLHTMHMLPSLQLVQAHLDGLYPLECESDVSVSTESQPDRHSLPPPSPNATTAGGNTTKPWSSILYGEPSPSGNRTSPSSSWHMNPVHCRTSFEPIRSGDLSEIIVSGSTGQEIDVMLPKSNMFYNRGWVLDMSDSEKQAKRKLDIFGGLGFVDRKKAYYGLFTSGTLHFLLGYEPPNRAKNSTTIRDGPKDGDDAIRWFRSVVLCEVNEKRDDPDACNMGRDVNVTVGGVYADAAMMMDAGATLYLGKKLCLYVPVPPSAKITSRATLLNESIALRQPSQRHQILVPNGQGDDGPRSVGLAVGIRVTNRHIMKPSSACSVSHVVWEQQPQPQQRLDAPNTELEVN